MILGLVPARGGSKGIRKKNIKELLGKPLIAYAIEQGLASPLIDMVVVSTDDPVIAEVARECGAEVPFMRPAELARDDTPMFPVMEHALDAVEAESGKEVSHIVLLDATSPLRLVSDIDNAMKLFDGGACDAVISGCEAHRSPWFNMVALDGEGYAGLLIGSGDVGRRQDCPDAYDLDTTVWIYTRDAIKVIKKRMPPRTRLYKVPQVRAFHIDTELDFEIVAFLMSKTAPKV